MKVSPRSRADMIDNAGRPGCASMVRERAFRSVALRACGRLNLIGWARGVGSRDIIRMDEDGGLLLSR